MTQREHAPPAANKHVTAAGNAANPVAAPRGRQIAET